MEMTCGRLALFFALSGFLQQNWPYEANTIASSEPCYMMILRKSYFSQYVPNIDNDILHNAWINDYSLFVTDYWYLQPLSRYILTIRVNGREKEQTDVVPNWQMKPTVLAYVSVKNINIWYWYLISNPRQCCSGQKYFLSTVHATTLTFLQSQQTRNQYLDRLLFIIMSYVSTISNGQQELMKSVHSVTGMNLLAVRCEREYHGYSSSFYVYIICIHPAVGVGHVSETYSANRRNGSCVYSLGYSYDFSRNNEK